jgi:predicted acetyltransferase
VASLPDGASVSEPSQRVDGVSTVRPDPLSRRRRRAGGPATARPAGNGVVTVPDGLVAMASMTAAPDAPSFSLRTATEEDWEAMYRVDARAFGFPELKEDRDAELPLVEFDRMLLAEDAGQVVGKAGAYSFTMSLPGAVAPVAGVTGVCVSPTHRRRGILTTLMRAQLDALHAHGEPVGALWASEHGIYGRFGYGLASSVLTLRVPRAGTRTGIAATGDDLAVWFADVGHARAEVAEVHAAQVTARPGRFRRDARWWDRVLADPEHRRDGASELRCLLAHDGRTTRGYALFATVSRWRDGLPAGELRVRDVEARDPDAYAALWRTLLGTDLVDTVVTHNRPVDDPLLHLLDDPRRAVPRVRDNLWVRLVDVDRALAGRTYAHDVDVVLEVADEFCPWNAGRWRLQGGPEGATCTATDAAVDLRLSARDLGAAYLGGTSLVALAAAGRVREEREGALRVTARAFWSDVAPCCPTVF